MPTLVIIREILAVEKRLWRMPCKHILVQRIVW